MTTDLPSGWVWTTLGEIGLYHNGRAFKSSDWSEAGRPIIRIQNLTGSGSKYNHFRGQVDQRHAVSDGDLLVSWAATLGVYVWRGPEAVLNQHIFKVESHISARFHRWLLESAVTDLYRQAHGSGMVHITKKKFEQTPVKLPPAAEQERIVDAIEEHFSRLDTLESVVANTRRRLGTLQSVALDRAFYAEEAAQIAEIGDFAEVAGGIQKQPKRRPLNNRYPFLRVANVGRGQLNLAEVHEIELFEGEIDRFRLEKGDLLVVEGNGSVNQIGRAALWSGEIGDCVHQNHLIRVRPGNELLPEYLALCWNAPRTVQQIRAVASSTSGLYTLSTGKVRSICIPLVPLPAQRRVIEQLDLQLRHVESACSAVAGANVRARTLRRAVLSQAFAGQLTSHNAVDESEKALLS